MDINSINNDNFVNRKRTDSLERARSKVNSSESGTSAGKSTPSDRLDLSSVAKNDLQVGRSALRNMDASMLNRVREIRANIKNGVYNTDEVFRNIANTLVAEFQADEAAEIASETQPAESSSRYTSSQVETLQQRLADVDDSIVSEIAERLLGEL